MASEELHPIAVALFEDPGPLTRAVSGDGKLKLSDGTVMSVWEVFEPLGAKKGTFKTTAPAKPGPLSWIVVVVNSLQTPLALTLNLMTGYQVGYAVVTDLQDIVEGTEDQVPASREDPNRPGVNLTGVAGWTFLSGTGGTGAFEMAMKLSYTSPTDGAGKIAAVAVRLGQFWVHPVSAITNNLEQFRKTSGDGDAALLQQFFDARTGDQGEYLVMSNETVWARICGVYENCLIVWIS